MDNRKELRAAAEVVTKMADWKDACTELSLSCVQSDELRPHTAQELADAIRFVWKSGQLPAGGLVAGCRILLVQMNSDDHREPTH